MASHKRKGRNGERPTNKRYTSEKRWEKNKARRAKRRERELAKAASVRHRSDARKAARRAAKQTQPTTPEEQQ